MLHRGCLVIGLLLGLVIAGCGGGSGEVSAPQVDAPSFSLPEGTYDQPQEIAISCATPDAAIRYTTDGQTPTDSIGLPYTDPLVIDADTTIRAVAYKAGLAISPVSTSTYGIRCYPPQFSPEPALYDSPQSVEISSQTPGASIRYTTDGTPPTVASGILYEGPVEIASSTTIRAVAYKERMSDSAEASAEYVITGTVAQPVFTPPLGVYQTAPGVAITTLPADATIRYTTDGTTPTTTNGTVYTESFIPPLFKPIKAVAYKEGWQTSPTATSYYSLYAQPSEANYIHLRSDPGDYIGQGATYLYTQADAVLSVFAAGAHLSSDVDGDEWWSGDFALPNTFTNLQAGYYGNLTRYPFHNASVGGLSWGGEGRGCNTLTGWAAVTNVIYEGAVLTGVDLDFEQHCEGGTPALHGQIHWTADDPTAPPGPVIPIPQDLWQPSAGFTPPAGNYAYLVSEPGDYIGAGQTYLYSAPTTVTVNPSANYMRVAVGGWYGDFKAMDSLVLLEPGFYGDLSRYPFHNPTKGGLSWSGNGRGCNNLTGWFALDDIVYVDNVLTSFDLRFEQFCDGDTAALHGKIHWVR